MRRALPRDGAHRSSRPARPVGSLEDAGSDLSSDAVVSVPSYDVGGFG
jgi:hypothetical protein